MDATEEVDDDGARDRSAYHARPGDPVRQQEAEAGAGVGLDHEQDGAAGGLGLLDAERGEDAVVDGVVEEQHLGRLDQDRGERQQVVGDQDAHAGGHPADQGGDHGLDQQPARDGQQHAEDAE
ncbi:hypothetical protein SDC9_98488 [bioreactor metagenome]|uniref:Uncharacterized protein n=1 Tax=bioreactor metagenome TaxID=1076179 RepID=A0A645AFE4_9ZZZZ